MAFNILLIFAAGAALAFWLPLIFIIVSVGLCLFLFYKDRIDFAWHERTWLTGQPYKDNPYRPPIEGFVRFWIILTLSLAGAVAAVLPCLAIRGTQIDRIIASCFVLTAMIFSVYGLSFVVKNYLRFDPLRYGLVRFSLPAGFIYSVLERLFHRKTLSQTWTDLSASGDYWKDTWQTLRGGDPMELVIRRFSRIETLDEFVELIHTVAATLDSMISSFCTTIFGPYLGWIPGLVITTNVAYGVPITVFGLSLYKIHHVIQGWNQGEGEPQQSPHAGEDARQNTQATREGRDRRSRRKRERRKRQRKRK